jgi:hypothetical protein
LKEFLSGNAPTFITDLKQPGVLKAGSKKPLKAYALTLIEQGLSKDEVEEHIIEYIKKHDTK